MRNPAKQNWFGRTLRRFVRCERGESSVLANILLTSLGIMGVGLTIGPTKEALSDIGGTLKDQASVVRNGATNGSAGSSGLGSGGSGFDFGSAIGGIQSAFSGISDVFNKFEDFKEQQQQQQQGEGKK